MYILGLCAFANHFDYKTHQNNKFVWHFTDTPNVDDCEQCSAILEELENIDDDCDRHGIVFVKTQDFSIAEIYGVTEYPALVYFENGVPNVFEGKSIRIKKVDQWVYLSIQVNYFWSNAILFKSMNTLYLKI